MRRYFDLPQTPASLIISFQHAKIFCSYPNLASFIFPIIPLRSVHPKSKHPSQISSPFSSYRMSRKGSETQVKVKDWSMRLMTFMFLHSIYCQKLKHRNQREKRSVVQLIRRWKKTKSKRHWKWSINKKVFKKKSGIQATNKPKKVDKVSKKIISNLDYNVLC